MLSHNIRPFINRPKGNGLTQSLVLALALFISSAVVLGTVPLFEPPYASPIHELLHSINHVLWWEFYAVGLLIGIALATLRLHSLLGAWILAFAGGAGVGINLGGIALTGDEPSILFRMFWAVGAGFATALIIGTAGYLLGIGLQPFKSSAG